MSKLLRKQLFSIWESLQEAQQVLGRLIAGNQWEEMSGLLADCQEGAIAIGNQMETIYGEGLESVHALESYCEILFHLAESKDVTTCEENYALAGDQLLIIKSHMEKEIPDRLEVVFLPYKAAMWDSLESIYLAAKEDPDCDAYCVPIPYYDLNSDRSFGELHDEQKEYPKNIKVTDWQTYQLEERKPDVIFIHNPYDDWNLVTSVEPRFYAKNLRNYTEKLVYVPYFVLDEIEPDNLPAIENMKHFCFLPGTIYADKVIVQSEGIKKIYIDEYIKAAQEQGAEVDREQLEEKFMGLGAPKFDKVQSMTREDLEIPEEWMKVIQKPEGTWKKIILYNTGVAAFLKYEDKMLKKIKSVLSLFKGKKDETALLWRPHPLLEKTMKSMRPGFLEEYQEIVKKYKEEGWGIYDDTPYMDRAVALSDAYYGDGSSMVWLFQKTGKLAMVQDVNEECERMKLSVTDLKSIDGDIIFLTTNPIGLFEYSVEKARLKYLGWGGKKNNKLSVAMCMYDNKVFVAPYYSDEMVIYDMKKNNFNRISLSEKLGISEKGLKHYHVVACYKNKAFFLGEKDSVMLCVNMDNYNITPIVQWKTEFMEQYGVEAGIFTHADICIVDDSFWIALDKKNMIMQYNMEKNIYSFYYVGERAIQYNTICFDGKFFWLTGDENFIVRWEKESNNIKIYDVFPEGFEVTKPDCCWKELFSGSLLRNNSIYLAPLKANMMLRIDLKTGALIKVKNVEKTCFVMKDIQKQGVYIQEDKETPYQNDNAYIINENKLNRMDFEMCLEDINNLEQFQNDGFYHSRALSLENNNGLLIYHKVT
ncbi:MAG: hypothetical protein IJE43_08940 [Alphaproteobacteria bacterium]|nr:hypothetical protein [Alphaproteobacteria bacterium]MBQ6888580.1 hypothetical protein [Lachnospiraceae bacterium]